MDPRQGLSLCPRASHSSTLCECSSMLLNNYKRIRLFSTNSLLKHSDTYYFASHLGHLYLWVSLAQISQADIVYYSCSEQFRSGWRPTRANVNKYKLSKTYDQIAQPYFSPFRNYNLSVSRKLFTDSSVECPYCQRHKTDKMVWVSAIRQSVKRIPMIRFRKGGLDYSETNVIAASIVGGNAAGAKAVSVIRPISTSY